MNEASKRSGSDPEQSRETTPPLGFAWHALSAVAIVALVTETRLGGPIWELPGDRRGFVLSLALTHLLGGLALWWQRRRGTRVSVLRAAGTFAASYGVLAFGLVMVRWYYSRSALGISLLLSLILATLGILATGGLRRRMVQGLGVGVALLVAFGYARYDASPEPSEDHVSVRLFSTMFHDVQLTESTRFARPGGGAAWALDRGFLLVSGDGRLHYLEEIERADSLVVRALPYHIPLNRQAFQADAPDADSGRFRVGDVLVQESGTTLNVIASHHFWRSDADRFVLRMSMAEAERDAFLDGRAGIEWRTVFDTKPSLPVAPAGRGSHSAEDPFSGHMLGGRLAALDDRTILLTVGDHAFDGWNAQVILAQDPNADYGKTVLVDLETGESEIYTLGHRNPQGLHVSSDGRIWLTEHGPDGGDELNLLERGANYGWPYETLGVEYGREAWPLSTDRGRHSEYESPVFAWLPSIAVSNLLVVERDLFPAWKGDLLVASLGGGSLFRLRQENGRIIFTERIEVGRRIRDLTEAPDGRILLLLDGFGIGILEPVPDDAAPDGELLFATCLACHLVDDGSAHGIGPDLRGVLGRDVASMPGYSYSSALRDLSGRWTEERLDQFLEDPSQYAPGTTMAFEGIPDATARQLLISYLEANR